MTNYRRILGIGAYAINIGSSWGDKPCYVNFYLAFSCRYIFLYYIYGTNEVVHCMRGMPMCDLFNCAVYHEKYKCI